MANSTAPTDGFKWIRFARDAPVSGPRKSVLFALASRSNATGECWPSVRTLARDAGVSERGARYALRELTADGWIEVRERPPGPGRRQGANRIRLIVRAAPRAA